MVCFWLMILLFSFSLCYDFLEGRGIIENRIDLTRALTSIVRLSGRVRTVNGVTTNRINEGDERREKTAAPGLIHESTPRIDGESSD